MDDGDSKPDSWLESLRRTGDSLLGLVQNRFELAGIELQEEKLRALNLIVWLAVAIALGTAGILVGMGVLAFFLWEKAGYAGVIGLSVVTLGCAAAILHQIRRRLQTAAIPFAGTVAEFRKDRECLRPKE